MAASGATPRSIELEVGVAKDILVDGGAPQERMDPGDQLDDRERLCQVIVSARLQALDPLLDRLTRRQHQDRDAALATYRTTGGQAVEVGHQDVEDNEVWPLRSVLVEDRQRFDAVFGEFDLEAFELERPADRTTQRVVVVDDENASRRASSARLRCLPSRLEWLRHVASNASEARPLRPRCVRHAQYA